MVFPLVSAGSMAPARASLFFLYGETGRVPACFGFQVDENRDGPIALHSITMAGTITVRPAHVGMEGRKPHERFPKGRLFRRGDLWIHSDPAPILLSLRGRTLLLKEQILTKTGAIAHSLQRVDNGLHTFSLPSLPTSIPAMEVPGMRAKRQTSRRAYMGVRNRALVIPL
jgi:hypothetical protein